MQILSRRNRVAPLFLLSITVLLLGGGLASACGSDNESEVQPLSVDDARYREAKPGLGAAYLTVTNPGSDPATLIGVSSPDAAMVEIHQTMADDEGTMSMHELPDGIEIGAGETVTLEPGGLHLMLMELDDVDGPITLSLDFGHQTITVSADPIQ